MDNRTISSSFDMAIEYLREKKFILCERVLCDIEERVYHDDSFQVEACNFLIKKIRSMYSFESYNYCNKKLIVKYQKDELMIRSGVSLVSCCMNRTANLIKSIKSWLALDIDEIVIIDWSSIIPVIEELKYEGISDERIKIIRVVNQKNWVLTEAFNLGFSCSSYSKVIKADADILISKSFFKKNIIGEGEFIAGRCNMAEKSQEYINGFFYIHRADFFLVNGFNEYITSYGWDDDDLYNRLEHKGLKRLNIKRDSIYHLSHSDRKRLNIGKKLVKSDFESFKSTTYYNIRYNYYMTEAMNKWGRSDGRAVFRVAMKNSNYYLIMKYSNSKTVPNSIRERATFLAKRDYIEKFCSAEGH